MSTTATDRPWWTRWLPSSLAFLNKSHDGQKNDAVAPADATVTHFSSAPVTPATPNLFSNNNNNNNEDENNRTGTQLPSSSHANSSGASTTPSTPLLTSSAAAFSLPPPVRPVSVKGTSSADAAGADFINVNKRGEQEDELTSCVELPGPQSLFVRRRATPSPSSSPFQQHWPRPHYNGNASAKDLSPNPFEAAKNAFAAASSDSHAIPTTTTITTIDGNKAATEWRYL